MTKNEANPVPALMDGSGLEVDRIKCNALGSLVVMRDEVNKSQTLTAVGLLSDHRDVRVSVPEACPLQLNKGRIVANFAACVTCPFAVIESSPSALI